jgi:hypothetical protein
MIDDAHKLWNEVLGGSAMSEMYQTDMNPQDSGK